MRLEEALVAVLNASNAVTSIVSDRIQCGESVPEWSSLPDLFFEVDHGNYEETFSGELEERRLQMVTLRVTSRALSISVAIQALAAATDALRDASGETITVEGDSAIAIEDLQVEDPGSDGGYEEIQRDGTTATVYYRVAQFHVAYYDNVEPGEDGGDDGDFENGSGTPTTRSRFYRRTVTLTADQATARAITLPQTPDTEQPVGLTPQGGCEQFAGSDFRVAGNTIRWDSAQSDWLYDVLCEGDVILVTYHA